ncbi:helix-turn-helix domain-containing protein [Streptomyces sp. C10]|uniref:helix-turn-helix domain-containing protein n=1 Tax=Streptomyces sp. C10 TaxID=531941 RepID=UPI00398157E0
MTSNAGGGTRWGAAAPVTTSDLLRSHRMKLGVSQEEFAQAHGFSVRAYGEMENGGKISMANMYALREGLHMGPQARAQFFRLVTGDAPSLRGLTVDEGLARVTAKWAEVHLYSHESPTVLMDGGWNAIHFNAAWAKLFDSIEPHPRDHPLDNPMQFCLFHPDAPRIFLDWEESWLVTAMCQFAHHYGLYHDSDQLIEIRRRIAQAPHLEALYTNRVRAELIERGAERIIAGDVSDRPLLVGRRPRGALLTVSIPWHAREYGYQLLTMSYPNDTVMPPASAGAPASRTRPATGSEGHTASCPAGVTAGRQALGERPPHDRAVTIGQVLREYRNRAGLTQEVLPRVTHLPVTARTYRKLETGKGQPRKEHVGPLAQALRMPTSVERFLYTLITKGDPPTIGVRGGPAVEALTERWARDQVKNQRAPTVLLDGAWDVIACNDAYRALFHHVPADSLNHPAMNGFRYVVFHPDARETLAEWYEQWAVPYLVEFGATLMRHRDAPHPEHLGILQEIQADPYLWKLYRGRVHRELQGGGTAIGFEGDGDVRGMYLPTGEGPDSERSFTKVLVTAGVPLHGKAYGYQFCTLTLRD